MLQRLAAVTQLPSLAVAHFKGYTGRSSTELLLSKLKVYRDAMLSANTFLPANELTQQLAVQDLTDPADGAHGMQLLLAEITAAMGQVWQVPTVTTRAPRIMPTADNYHRLGFDVSAIARDRRYSFHVDEDHMLRTHMSSAGPSMLAGIDHTARAYDQLHVLPGVCYRRDTVDRFHVGALHQVDYWRIRRGRNFTANDLRTFAATIVEAIEPGAKWRLVPASHPYTHHAKQIDIWFDGQWLELAECGIVSNKTMRRNGLPATHWSGILLGIGLDRAMMVRKGMPDIRLLRSTEPAIAAQLQDLSPWRPVGEAQQITRKNLSLVVDAHEDDDTLGDKVRAVLGSAIDHVEQLRLTSKQSYLELHPDTRAALHVREGQAKIDLEITLRSLSQHLSEAEIEDICNRIRTHLHQRQEMTYEMGKLKLVS